MSEIPMNGTTLAAEMGRGVSYISAMKSGGYVFTHGTRTLLSDALKWLSEHPDFRSTGYRMNAPGFVKDRARSESAKLRMRLRHPQPATAGTVYE